MKTRDSSTDDAKEITMTMETRREQLLAKAKEADEMAARATDVETRNKWLEIARHYRALAAGLV